MRLYRRMWYHGLLSHEEPWLVTHELKCKFIGTGNAVHLGIARFLTSIGKANGCGATNDPRLVSRTGPKIDVLTLNTRFKSLTHPNYKRPQTGEQNRSHDRCVEPQHPELLTSLQSSGRSSSPPALSHYVTNQKSPSSSKLKPSASSRAEPPPDD